MYFKLIQMRKFLSLSIRVKGFVLYKSCAIARFNIIEEKILNLEIAAPLSSFRVKRSDNYLLTPLFDSSHHCISVL